MITNRLTFRRCHWSMWPLNHQPRQLWVRLGPPSLIFWAYDVCWGVSGSCHWTHFYGGVLPPRAWCHAHLARQWPESVLGREWCGTWCGYKNEGLSWMGICPGNVHASYIFFNTLNLLYSFFHSYSHYHIATPLLSLFPALSFNEFNYMCGLQSPIQSFRIYVPPQYDHAHHLLCHLW